MRPAADPSLEGIGNRRVSGLYQTETTIHMIVILMNIRSLYRALVPKALTWSFCVKAEAKLAGLLLRVVPIVFGHLTLSSVKVTWGFAKNVAKMYRAMGSKGTAIYLKACYVLTQHAAGGMRDLSPWALGANVSRTRRGLPRLINPQQRSLIIKGEVAPVRFWLTLLSLYRVLEFKGTLKLATITKPGIDISGFMTDWSRWVPVFYDKIRFITGDEWKMDPSFALTPYSIPFIRKASPNSGGWASVMALPWDVALYGSDRAMRAALLQWLKLTDGLEMVWGLKKLWKLIALKATWAIEEFDGLRPWTPEWSKRWTWRTGDPGQGPKVYPLWYEMRGSPLIWLTTRLNRDEADRLAWYLRFHWGKPLWFGRLGFKEEPGKIRVFAMVNILTQTLMYPLHKWIFERLRMVSTDGTFNQTAPVERLIKRFNKEGHWVASYDLSAATDRLPLALQVELLKPILGAKLSELWAYLLVGRPYGLPRSAKSWNLGFDRVSYAVGQPMGAFSSWALLALTHHAIVQYAAFRVTSAPGWFLLYAVLGDDVVIADRAVAREYLRIMKAIGVEIGLAKSLVSKDGSLEFAKRTWIRGRDATPVSLAEMLVALRSLGALGELVAKNMKFGVIRISSVARFCGHGFRNLARLPVALSLGNRLSGLIAYLCRPGGIFPMPLEAWLLNVAPMAQEGQLIDPNRWTIAQSLWSRTLSELLKRVVKFERLLYDLSTARYSDLTIRVKAKGDVKSGERAAGHTKTEERKFFGESNVKFFGFDRDDTLWNEFFTEWIARPFTNGLRKPHEVIDDRLRVLDPSILPAWHTLYDLFKELGTCEEGVNTLPNKVEYAYRLEDDKAPSARLITLWRQLRKIARRERIVSVSIREGFVNAPQARRRRRGG